MFTFLYLHCAGGVELPLAKLPNGQDYDHWHTMVIPGTKASRGTLRLVATFKHEVILPLEEYRALSEVGKENKDGKGERERLSIMLSPFSYPDHTV